MAMTTTYLTVNGKIRSEQRAGEAHSRDYVLDRLGSVIQIYQNGWPIADACYEPYGGIYTQWNMEGKTFTWLGGWGYRQTGVEWSSVYVRARHYARFIGSWLSVDPLWPEEMAYGYVEGRVMVGVDYWGMQSEPILSADECFVYCSPLSLVDPPLYPVCESACNAGLTISEMNDKFYDIMKRKRRGLYNPRHDTDCFAMAGSGGWAYRDCEWCCSQLYDGKDDCTDKLHRCTCHCSKFYAGNTGDCPPYTESRRKPRINWGRMEKPNAREIPWWEYLGGLIRRQKPRKAPTRLRRRRSVPQPPKVILPPGSIPPAGYQDPSSGRYY